MAESYWIYSRVQRSQSVTQRFNGWSIAITLDAGAQNAFSGIRLIIVLPDDPEMGLDKVRIRDGLPSCVFGSNPIVTTRERLRRNREAKVLAHHVSNLNYPRDDLPFCSVVYELSSIPDLPLRQCHLKTIPSSLPLLNPRLIIYDRIYLCTPASPSCFALLQLICPPRFLGPRRNPFNIIETHAIRVLPTHRHAPCGIHRLPREVHRKIVWLALDTHLPRWRATLLTLALVQKSWLHLIGILFESMGRNLRPPLRPVDVLRVLQRQPTHAHLIKAFSTEDFTWIPDTKFLKARLEHEAAMSDIISRFTAVTAVHLGNNFYAKIIPQLRVLRHTTKLEMRGDTWPRLTPSLSQIFEIITEESWENLRDITLDGWTDSVATREVPETSFCLRSLILRNGLIKSEQLNGFIRHQSLRTVELTSVQGLSNKDLFDFLSCISAGLESLTLADLSYPSHSPTEEFALDAVMPSLSALSMLSVFGNGIISSLSIARKREDSPSGNRLAKPIKKLIMQHQPSSIQDGFVDAIRVTGWGLIVVRWAKQSWIWDESTRLEAMSIALQRGIQLDINHA